MFNIRNMEQKISEHTKMKIFMVCDTKSGRYCTDLNAYTSKQQKVVVHADCYHKEMMSSDDGTRTRNPLVINLVL